MHFLFPEIDHKSVTCGCSMLHGINHSLHPGITFIWKIVRIFLFFKVRIILFFKHCINKQGHSLIWLLFSYFNSGAIFEIMHHTVTYPKMALLDDGHYKSNVMIMKIYIFLFSKFTFCTKYYQCMQCQMSCQVWSMDDLPMLSSKI